MDLPNLLNRLKTNQADLKRFLAIEITPTIVKTAVWQVRGSVTEVVTVGSFQTWESESEDDLLTAIDTSLSEALAGLPSEPNEVIFGLPETWVNQDSIADSKKNIIRTICKKLALKAVGFVVTSEAIIHYLRDTEGGPPSAILIHISPDEIGVSLVYLGNMEGTQVVGRSQDLSSDVEEGLARFPHIANLPSRMILFDSKEDLESAKQNLISHEWQKNLPFLHFPKIEALPKDATIKAVAIAGGAEVAKALGITSDEPAQEDQGTQEFEEIEPSQSVEPEIEDATYVNDSVEEDVLPTNSQEVSGLAREFGFTGFASKEFETGFDQDKPAFTTKAAGHDSASSENYAASTPSEPISTDSEPKNSAKTGNKPFMLSKLPKFALKIPHFKLNLPFPKKKSSQALVPRKKIPLKVKLPGLIIAGVVLLILLGSVGTFAYWQFPKATVTVFVALKPLPKASTFTLNPDTTSVDPAQNSIPGKKEVVTVSGELTLPTTGTKTIGERAKGRVAIYNRTLSAKTFSAGTTISTDTLRFTLDEDVTIASASTKENPDFSITTEPSKNEVAVSAVDIGDKYNIAQNTQFKVANFASESFVAQAVTAMQGGYANEVKAVSKEDQTRLKNELNQSLKQQVVAKLTAETADKGVVDTGDVKVIEENFSHTVGQESESLSLNMSVESSAYTYDRNDITVLLQQQAFNDIPPGYNVVADATTIEVGEAEVTAAGTVVITAQTTLQLVPKLDTDNIARTIRGKYPPVTESFFRGLPGYVSTQTVIKPSLPARLNTFPQKLENIEVIVKPVAS